MKLPRLFRSARQRVRRRHHSNQSVLAKQRLAYVPRLEALEERALLAVSPGLFVADAASDSILQIDTATGDVSVAVSQAEIMAASGKNSNTLHFFTHGMAIGPAKNLYFTLRNHGDILQYDGANLSILVSASDIQAVTGSNPRLLHLDTNMDGDLFVFDGSTNDILKVDTVSTNVSIFSPGQVPIFDLTTRPDGGLYVSENSGNVDRFNAIHVVDAAGARTQIAAGSMFSDLDVYGALAPNGDYIVADDCCGGDEVFRVTPAGEVTTFLSDVDISTVTGQAIDLEGGIEFDVRGNLYMAEHGSGQILKFDQAQNGSVFVTTADIQAVTGVVPNFQADIAYLAPPNVNPTITLLTSSAQVCQGVEVGDAVTVSGTFEDTNLEDLHRVVIDWGDGTVSDSEIDLADFTSFDGDGGGSGSFSATHAYANGGIHEVRVTVYDDLGGLVVESTQAVIAGVGISPDGELQIVGTDGEDTIRMPGINEDWLSVRARINRGRTQRFEFHIDSINATHIITCAADDRIDISEDIVFPATIDAGPGDDRVQSGGGDDFIEGNTGDDDIDGGDGNDVVLGQEGDDKLEGGRGFDLVIGGGGEDYLRGRSAIFIGGHVTLNATELTAARDIWADGSSYAARVTSLTGVGGLLEAGVTVLDDNTEDKFKAGSGDDLFFAKLGTPNEDRIRGKKLFEDLLELF